MFCSGVIGQECPGSRSVGQGCSVTERSGESVSVCSDAVRNVCMKVVLTLRGAGLTFDLWEDVSDGVEVFCNRAAPDDVHMRL